MNILVKILICFSLSFTSFAATKMLVKGKIKSQSSTLIKIKANTKTYEIDRTKLTLSQNEEISSSLGNIKAVVNKNAVKTVKNQKTISEKISDRTSKQ